jgi:hypothetical protein
VKAIFKGHDGHGRTEYSVLSWFKRPERRGNRMRVEPSAATRSGPLEKRLNPEEAPCERPLSLASVTALRLNCNAAVWNKYTFAEQTGLSSCALSGTMPY